MTKEENLIKLSIIIPYYNTYEYTVELLDNLMKQKTDEVEIILIDDGCNEVRLDKYDINVIHVKNGGVSKARNIGLSKYKGQYVAFIDSDDNVMPNFIEKWLKQIDKGEFDYGYHSWKYSNGRDMIITDQPPKGNNSVWNCVYNRKVIGENRFPENLQIGEEIKFNQLTRKGKQVNIEDVLYIYNSGREDSLSTQYLAKKITEERPNEVNTQVVLYRSYLSLIGGIETALYNACYELSKVYDVVFMYDTADAEQLKRLKKLVKCVKFDNQPINCGTFYYYGLNPTRIDKYITAQNDVVQIICNNMEDLKFHWERPSKTTKIVADSEASAKAFEKVFPREKCGVLYNLFIKPEERRVLHLVTASRLSPEKGWNRMKAMAKKLHEKSIPFIWEIFTNEKPDELIDGMIFRKPRLDVCDHMWGADYGLQLSDSESHGNTITEFQERNVPTIVTDFASAGEQIKDGKNGFILKRDLSNLDEVVEKMYSSNLKGFKYKPQYSVKQWQEMIGDLGGKYDVYEYIEEPELIKKLASDIIRVRVIRTFKDAHKMYHRGKEMGLTLDQYNDFVSKGYKLIVLT